MWNASEMMSGMGMWGGGIVWLLFLVLCILGVLALLKYLRN
jgi:hypothetical protein